MVKKHKKQQKKSNINKQYILFFGLVIFLFLALFEVQNWQVFRPNAATVHTQAITGCGDVGDSGNSLGVGKYCTAGGGQCVGTGASICSADIQSGPGLCSKPCSTNADCGTGATCVASTLGSGCEPIACQTPSTSPSPSTGVVPSKACLGGVNCASPAPSASQTPSKTVNPKPTSSQSQTPSTGGGGLNLLQLLIQFIQLIIGFLTSLI